MARKYILIASLLVCGCGVSPGFNPSGDQLSDAVQGEPYVTKIVISKGVVITDSLVGKFDKENSGFTIENCKYPPEMEVEPNDIDYNCALVKGVPGHSGVIHLTIKGRFYGTMFTSGSSFEKTYKIRVREK